MPVDDETLRELLRLIEARPSARAELRRLLLSDGLEDALRNLAGAQTRTEGHLASLAARMDQLAEAQTRTERQMEHLAGRVGELVTWQAGEAGRRNSEQYERQVRRRALSLFQGGSGGCPTEARVQQRLEDILADLVAAEIVLDRHDPLLVDLMWWKDDSYAVAEVALVVEWDDVYRAHERAETLRRAGQDKGVRDVLPVVFGQAWSSPEVRAEAERLGVAWWVGDDLAPRLLEYRRKRPSPR
ncbi:MAG: hypothetical protein HY690_02845 [Chloroflexi bacterium]|nr:hypothetical protein [Chloroflexota bacterium]